VNDFHLCRYTQKGPDVPNPMISRGTSPVLAGPLAPVLALSALLLVGCAGGDGPRIPGLGAGWSGPGPDFPTESVTIRRIRNAPTVESNVLSVEPGNVWPEQEGQRATLADPDAALQGLPRASFPDAPRQVPLQRIAPRADGQLITTPDGAAITTGGTDRVQGTLSPRGSGVAIRDGGTVTIVEPGRQPRLVPAPR
jgi:hypothetical protein